MNVYMAGPLFTSAERAHNLRLAELLEQRDPIFKCILPQVRGEALYPDLKAVFKDCLEQAEHAGVVVACVDGAESDSGTAFEMGFAYGKGVPIVAYRTDFRGSEIDGLNAMLRFGCTEFISAPSFKTTLEQLAEEITNAIHRALCHKFRG